MSDGQVRFSSNLHYINIVLHNALTFSGSKHAQLVPDSDSELSPIPTRADDVTTSIVNETDMSISTADVTPATEKHISALETQKYIADSDAETGAFAVALLKIFR